jgi:DNA mismatch endonuclease, patch repair protein
MGKTIFQHPISAATANVMRANKGANTRPEIAIRSALHKLGCRYRVNYRIQAGHRKCRPDIVFTKAKLVVFIDGCFWHHCPYHGKIPKSNIDYWQQKFERNKARDRQDTEALISHGWTVLRLWEHTEAAEAIESIVTKLSQKQDGSSLRYRKPLQTTAS